MINFNISGTSEGLITVVKPTGKPLSVNVGEVIKAAVLDILPSGGVTLKVKGTTITARTDIPLQKNSEVFLKILGAPSSSGELKLQFAGYAESKVATPLSPKAEALARLVQEMAGAPANKLTAGDIQTLLKALPQEAESLPPEIRAQLQELLQTSLKTAGQSIQTRLTALLSGSLPEAIKNDPAIAQALQGMSVNVERLVASELKPLLQDTGTSLEAKLRAIADMLRMTDEPAPARDAGSGAGLPPRGAGQAAEQSALLQRDLKAGLLQLRELIVERGEAAVSTSAGNKAGVTDTVGLKAAVSTVDGLLKDIETFQLLSKTTDSFCTFLPVRWEDLRDGDISFKKHEGSGKTPYFSCRLNLDLDSHGKLSVMVLMANGEYMVSFRPEGQALKELLASRTGELEEQFRKQGLTLKALSVEDREAPLLDPLDSSGPMVSVKV